MVGDPTKRQRNRNWGREVGFAVAWTLPIVQQTVCAWTATQPLPHSLQPPPPPPDEERT